VLETRAFDPLHFAGGRECARQPTRHFFARLPEKRRNSSYMLPQWVRQPQLAIAVTLLGEITLSSTPMSPRCLLDATQAPV
jgi:hypothetical protein